MQNDKISALKKLLPNSGFPPDVQKWLAGFLEKLAHGQATEDEIDQALAKINAEIESVNLGADDISMASANLKGFASEISALTHVANQKLDQTDKEFHNSIDETQVR